MTEPLRTQDAHGVPADAAAGDRSESRPGGPALPRTPWWTPFRRPITWLAIVGFAVLNVVVLESGLPEFWSVVISGALLALAVAVALRPRSVWGPVSIFLGVLATHAVLRLGGMPAFVVFESVLLLVGIVMWRHRAPTTG